MMAENTSTDPLARQAQLFKLLTHPARLAILEELRRDEACVCHLEAALGLRQAYLSQQLAVLRAAGLLLDRRDGWNVYYSIADHAIFDLLDISRQVLGISASQPAKSRAAACPCPKCTPAG